jgi:hypothetical protein
MISLNEILKRVNSTNSNNIYLAFVELNQLKNSSSILTALSTIDAKSNNNNNIIVMNDNLNRFNNTTVDTDFIDEYSFGLNNKSISSVTSSNILTTTNKKINQVQKDRYAYSYQPGII